MDRWKRSGQIPSFGDWEHANELPITQYFESARQAGLIRNSSSGDCEQYMQGGGSRSGDAGGGEGGGGDLNAAHFRKPSREFGPPPRKSREKTRVARTHVKEEQKRQGKACEVIEPARKHHHHQHYPMSANKTKDINGVNLHHHHHTDLQFTVTAPSKAVDEDLYKIPSHLLTSSNRKKMRGFFSCLVPTCAS